MSELLACEYCEKEVSYGKFYENWINKYYKRFFCSDSCHELYNKKRYPCSFCGGASNKNIKYITNTFYRFQEMNIYYFCSYNCKKGFCLNKVCSICYNESDLKYVGGLHVCTMKNVFLNRDSCYTLYLNKDPRIHNY